MHDYGFVVNNLIIENNLVSDCINADERNLNNVLVDIDKRLQYDGSF